MNLSYPLTAALLSLALAGCGQSPYEAYLACKQTIEQATVLGDTSACYLQANAPYLQSPEEAQEHLQQLQSSGRAISGLVREDALVDDDAQRVALRLGYTDEKPEHTVSGYSAIMQKVDGQWKLERSKVRMLDITRGSLGSASARVEFAGTHDLKSQNMIARYKGGDPNYYLRFEDQFESIAVMFSSNQPLVPGSYDFNGPISAEISAGFQEFFSRDPVGTLVIEEHADGTLSGNFEVSLTSNNYGDMSAKGSFAQVPTSD
ncbi:MAG: hypothetical protein ACR2PZ_00795 [Pseudomonadales bacterium]